MNELPVSIPQLSVVVAIISDTTTKRVDTSQVRGCLDALQHQIDPPAMEIIVPYHRMVQDVEQLKTEYPRVTFLDVDALISPEGGDGNRKHHQEMRALGLAHARGEIVGLLEDVGRPNPRWCAQAVAVHRQDYAAIGGAIENEIDRPLNWAVYFCDFGVYQNPLPEGPTSFASDANVTFKRRALEGVRPVWRKAFHEPDVNAALLAKNQRLALSPDLVVYQHRIGLEFGSALRERVAWARLYAANRCGSLDTARRLMMIVLSPLLPLLLVLRMVARVARKGRTVGPFLRVLPLTVCLTVAWAWGELLGYVTGRASGSQAQPNGLIRL